MLWSWIIGRIDFGKVDTDTLAYTLAAWFLALRLGYSGNGFSVALSAGKPSDQAKIAPWLSRSRKKKKL